MTARAQRMITRHHRRFAVGGTLIALAVVGVVYPQAWQHHQSAAGHRLVVRDRSRANVVDAGSRACVARAGPGVLVIPALGVTAPVAQGLSDAVLAVALGHDPATPWPSPGSASVVAGHDVGFLSQDTRLRSGNVLSYQEPCATLHYVVERHVISAPGEHVAIPRQGGLVLDSCWPTDALWYTPQRYLVIARYVSTTRDAHDVARVPAPPSIPTVELPVALTNADVSLVGNPWPMGTLHIVGTPSTSWSQSQAALGVETDALDLLFGLRHELAGSGSGGLSILAPGLSIPAWLAGSPAGALDVTEQITGSHVGYVELSSSVRSAGATVTFSMMARVRRSFMTVTAVRQMYR